jgi:hypothetical protein
MGHHSPAFTLSVYVHLLADDLPDVSILNAEIDSRVEKTDHIEDHWRCPGDDFGCAELSHAPTSAKRR